MDTRGGWRGFPKGSSQFIVRRSAFRKEILQAVLRDVRCELSTVNCEL
jgi:hypothetical protein